MVIDKLKPVVEVLNKLGNERLAALVNLSLVVVLAHSLALFSWSFWPEETEGAGMGTVAPVAATGNQSRVDLRPVTALHLFGNTEVKPVVAEKPTIEAQETNLNLTLRGIVANDGQGGALAIIAVNNGPEQTYRPGDNVSGGARLEEIHPDRVILSRGGKMEKLTLPKEKSPEGMAMQSEANAPAALSRRRPARTMPSASSSSRLSEYREKLISDPQALMGLASVQPVMENGSLKGYRLAPGSDPRLFAEVGLRPGDVATMVNGIEVGDPTRMGDIINELTTASSLNVTVERNGRTQNLSINF